VIDLYEVVKKQFPTGRAWAFAGTYSRGLLLGLAREPERMVEFLRGIVLESNPGTAEATLQEWFNQYDAAYKTAGAVSVKRAQMVARWIALGGQDIIYLQNALNQAGYGSVTIVEGVPPTDTFVFYLQGTLNTTEDALGLSALVQRLSPAHCAPDYTGIALDLNVYGAAVCGKGRCTAS